MPTPKRTIRPRLDERDVELIVQGLDHMIKFYERMNRTETETYCETVALRESLANREAGANSQRRYLRPDYQPKGAQVGHDRIAAGAAK